MGNIPTNRLRTDWRPHANKLTNTAIWKAKHGEKFVRMSYGYLISI